VGGGGKLVTLRKQKHKGYIFTLDAFFATVITLGMIGALLLFSFGSKFEFRATQNVAKDLMNVLDRTGMTEVLGNPERFPLAHQMYENGSIKEEDLNDSVLEMIGAFWARGNHTLAGMLATEVLNVTIPRQFGFDVVFNGESIYGSNVSALPRDIPRTTNMLVSDKRLISGIEAARPVKGYAARAWLETPRRRTDKIITFPPAGSGYSHYIWRENLTYVDLEATAIHVSSGLVDGDRALVNATITNIETGNCTTPFVVQLFLDDVEKQAFNVSYLEGKHSLTFQTSFIVTSGNHTASIIVDSTDAVDELSEGLDNEARVDFYVSPRNETPSWPMYHHDRSHSGNYNRTAYSLASFRQTLNNFSLLWGYQTGGNIDWSPAIADLDNDSYLEVIIGSGDGNLYAIHHNGTLYWSYNLSSTTVRNSAAIADVNFDGKPEVITESNNNQITAIYGNGSLMWTGAHDTGQCSPAIGDVLPGNNRLEIVGCKGVFDGLTGASLCGFTGRDDAAPTVYDVDGDGTQEMIVRRTSGSLMILNATASGSCNIERETAAGLEGYSLVAGDVNDDGWIEIVAPTSVGGADRIVAFNSSNLAEVWHFDIPNTTPSSPMTISPTIVDLDGDNRTDFLAADINGYVFALYGNNGSTKWTRKLNEEIQSGPAVGDVNGDGVLEIICGSQNTGGTKGNVSVLDATSGNVISTFKTEGSNAIKSEPTIGDIDGNGQLDMLFGAGNGKLYATYLLLQARNNWWNCSWKWRQPITLTATNGTIRDNERVNVNLSFDFGQEGVCSKRIRLVDENLVETPYNYVSASSGDKYVDDSVPAGATVQPAPGWDWVNSPVHSGTLSHRQTCKKNEGWHGFQNANTDITLNTSKSIVTSWVYIDGSKIPDEIMLEFCKGSDCEHRAFWGSNSLSYGTLGTGSRRNMGALPASDTWVQLNVTAGNVSLNGSYFDGMKFRIYKGSGNGLVYFDEVIVPQQACTSTNISFNANVFANSSKTYYVYYGNDAASEKEYTIGSGSSYSPPLSKNIGNDEGIYSTLRLNKYGFYDNDTIAVSGRVDECADFPVDIKITDQNDTTVYDESTNTNKYGRYRLEDNFTFGAESGIYYLGINSSSAQNGTYFFSHHGWDECELTLRVPVRVEDDTNTNRTNVMAFSDVTIPANESSSYIRVYVNGTERPTTVEYCVNSSTQSGMQDCKVTFFLDELRAGAKLVGYVYYHPGNAQCTDVRLPLEWPDLPSSFMFHNSGWILVISYFNGTRMNITYLNGTLILNGSQNMSAGSYKFWNETTELKKYHGNLRLNSNKPVTMVLGNGIGMVGTEDDDSYYVIDWKGLGAFKDALAWVPGRPSGTLNGTLYIYGYYNNTNVNLSFANGTLVYSGTIGEGGTISYDNSLHRGVYRIKSTNPVTAHAGFWGNALPYDNDLEYATGKHGYSGDTEFYLKVPSVAEIAAFDDTLVNVSWKNGTKWQVVSGWTNKALAANSHDKIVFPIVNGGSASCSTVGSCIKVLIHVTSTTPIGVLSRGNTNEADEAGDSSLSSYYLAAKGGWSYGTTLMGRTTDNEFGRKSELIIFGYYNGTTVILNATGLHPTTEYISIDAGEYWNNGEEGVDLTRDYVIISSDKAVSVEVVGNQTIYPSDLECITSVPLGQNKITAWAYPFVSKITEGRLPDEKTGTFRVSKTFTIPADAENVTARIQLSINENGGNVTGILNNQTVFTRNFTETGLGGGAYIVSNISIDPALIVAGDNNTNTFELVFDRPDSYFAKTNPGTILTVGFTSNETLVPTSLYRNETVLFSNITGHPVAWAAEGFYVPPASNLSRAMLHVEWKGVESYILVVMNGQTLYTNTSVNSTIVPAEGSLDVNISNLTQVGMTNVVSIYLDINGSSIGCGGDAPLQYRFYRATLIPSSAQEPRGEAMIKNSYISLEYNATPVWEYNRIDVTLNKEFGGQTENNKTTQFAFATEPQHITPVDTTVHLVEQGSWKIAGSARPESTVRPSWNLTDSSFVPNSTTYYKSLHARAVPEALSVPIEMLTKYENNYLDFVDFKEGKGLYCGNSISNTSILSYTVLVDSIVNYGVTFDTINAARDDATYRLNQSLYGIFGYDIISENADRLHQDSITMSDVPYMWGPAVVELRVWV